MNKKFFIIDITKGIIFKELNEKDLFIFNQKIILFN